MERSAFAVPLLAAAGLAFAACRGAEDGRCVHILARGGTRTGGTSSAVTLTGEATLLPVTSPFAPCFDEAVQVTAELYDEGNLRQPVEVLQVEPRPEVEVQAQVRFTADTPGAWLLRVAFEPALGLVQVPVAVVANREAPAFSESFPEPLSDCFDGLGRTHRGAVVCSRQGVATVYRAGSPVETFQGAGVVVVGDVVWSVTSFGVLQRRVDLEGGLALTGTLAGFRPDFQDTPGEHTETQAVRTLASGDFTQVRFDGALALSGAPRSPASPDGFIALQGDGLWQLTPWGELFDLSQPPPRLPLRLTGELLGVSAQGVWFLEAGVVGLLRRPFSLGAPQRLSGSLPSGLYKVGMRVDVASHLGWAALPLLTDGTSESLVVVPEVREGAVELAGWRPPGKLHAVAPDWFISEGADSHLLHFQSRAGGAAP